MDARVKRREYELRLPEHGTTLRVQAAIVANFGKQKSFGTIIHRGRLRILLTFFGGEYEAVANAFAEICANRDNMVLTLSNGCAEVQFTAGASWD